MVLEGARRGSASVLGEAHRSDDDHFLWKSSFARLPLDSVWPVEASVPAGDVRTQAKQ